MGSSKTPLTIVLPARNEASHIGTCLDALARQTHRGRVRIVVVANQCTDGTAALARGARDALPGTMELRVLERAAASKPEALNAGEVQALDGHRVYLDADAVLSPGALAAISETLDGGNGIHLCAPRREIREPESYAGRCYSRVWSTFPYTRDSIVFSGVYAVSRAGRERWGRFPGIQSDDKFVRLHFRADEQCQLDDAFSQVRIPEGVGRLFRARLRWCRGNGDLCREYAHLTRRDLPRYRGALRALAARPDVWPQVPCYAALHIGASLVARLIPRSGEQQWTRGA